MSSVSQTETDHEEYERAHVHEVYSQIAPHFSQTRHKPWPLISDFLLTLPAGSVGIDVGCGNGKYLDINPQLYIIGSDRSQELVGIARAEKSRDKFADAVVGDALDLPHQKGRFDFAICIAVVHHLSNRKRRIEAVKVLLDVLTSGGEGREAGKALVYVWALEQKNSRRGWDKGDEQDVMVPWVMRQKATEAGSQPNEQTFERYYHLYRKGELEEDIDQAGGTVLQHGYEKDNWWAIACRRQVVNS